MYSRVVEEVEAESGTLLSIEDGDEVVLMWNNGEVMSDLYWLKGIWSIEVFTIYFIKHIGTDQC